MVNFSEWYDANKICPSIDDEHNISREVLISDGERVTCVSYGLYNGKIMWPIDDFEVLFWAELPSPPEKKI